MGDENELVVEGQTGDETVHGREGSDERFVPYDRFKAVNDKAKRADELQKLVDQYKAYGNPEDLRQLKARHDELASGSTFTPSEKEKMRKELLETLPEIKQLNSFFESQNKTYIHQGSQKVNKYVAELGLEVNETRNHFIQELIAGCIAKDQGMLSRFASNDPSVYDDAWKIVKKELWGSTTRKPAGADVVRLKKPAVPGTGVKKTTNQEEPKNERDSIDDAGEQAYALLQSMGEGD